MRGLTEDKRRDEEKNAEHHGGVVLPPPPSTHDCSPPRRTPRTATGRWRALPNGLQSVSSHLSNALWLGGTRACSPGSRSARSSEAGPATHFEQLEHWQVDEKGLRAF